MALIFFALATVGAYAIFGWLGVIGVIIFLAGGMACQSS